jgi:5'-3' exonuclease
MLMMLGDGATHVGVATDHVIESWRNDLWATYKDGTGIDPLLKAQFPILEQALQALGLTVWAMVEDEADDALGTAALVAAADDRIEQVLVCTPDKDLGQVVGGKIVQYDRRKGGTVIDADGIRAKFGVDPESIPDYLALVGDSADGFPGIQGWGAKSAAAVLAHYKHIEAIPPAAGQWEVSVRSSPALAARLTAQLETALLFKRLATLNCDCAVGTVDQWEWRGATPAFAAVCERLDAPDYPRRADRLAAGR